MLDAENGFLLTSNTNPLVPSLLDNESGWYQDGEVPDPIHKTKNSSSKATTRIDNMLSDCEQQLKNVSSLSGTIEKHLEAAKDKKRGMLELLDEQRALKKRNEEIQEDDLFSPGTKQTLAQAIEMERTQIIKEAKKRLTLQRNDEAQRDDDDDSS